MFWKGSFEVNWLDLKFEKYFDLGIVHASSFFMKDLRCLKWKPHLFKLKMPEILNVRHVISNFGRKKNNQKTLERDPYWDLGLTVRASLNQRNIFPKKVFFINLSEVSIIKNFQTFFSVSILLKKSSFHRNISIYSDVKSKNSSKKVKQREKKNEIKMISCSLVMCDVDFSLTRANKRIFLWLDGAHQIEGYLLTKMKRMRRKKQILKIAAFFSSHFPNICFQTICIA